MESHDAVQDSADLSIPDSGVDDAAIPVASEQDVVEDELEITRRLTLARTAKESGNAFVAIQDYLAARDCYTEAIQHCPRGHADGAALFANRALCALKLEDDEKCIADCATALQLQPVYPKVRLRRAAALERLQRLDEALTDYTAVLADTPSDPVAKEAVQRLPQAITDQREKLKTEMFGKLKDLGNMCLKPFGLSTDNFKMVQDPATGSYSMSFQQKQ